ncbi:hypothetical protein VNI00_004262 [Paramarasmius palmivorus]|uniref:F-box domain-containing protein n=1 Tax=Paramarasmius palmivorus TaxID=297713 RepID=A0AAW0DNF8_9AGAR
MSSSVPSPQLPFEIIEKILIYLTGTPVRAQDTHYPDLLTCSLISRSWVAPVRKLMWNLVYFVVPSTEERLSELKILCNSEYSTLQLDRIVYLWMTDPQGTTFSSFLEAFQARLPGVRSIRLKSSCNTPLAALIGPEFIAALDFWSLRTLELHGATFRSIDEFLALFCSLNDLEFLSCHDIRLTEDRDLDQSRTSTVPHIHTLQVDVTLFFTLFSHVTLSHLNELILEDDPGTSWAIWSDWPRFGTTDDLPAEILDLPKHTPKLRELSLYMGGPGRSFETYATFYTYHMLTLPKPHPTLSILRLPVLPTAQITRFDRLLQDCMPNLQALKFATELLGESIQDALDDAKQIDMEELEERSVSNPQLRSVRDRAKAFLDGLERSMPFCAARKCLFPTFVTDEEGIEAFISQ